MRLRNIVISIVTASLFMTGVYASDSADYPGDKAPCVGNAKWLNLAYKPSKDIEGNDNCAFQQFAWEWFSDIIKPTIGAKARFETWMPSDDIFVPNGQKPTPWIANFLRSHIMGKNRTGTRLAATEQAGSMQPLISQNGEYVYYEVIVNKPAYNFITECDLYKSNCASYLKYNNKGIKLPNSLAFPDNSIELKNAWMILGEDVPKGLYFETIGTVINPDTNKEEVRRLGLIGMHLIINTATHPEFIWATFEHRNNAPDCNNTSANPPLGGKWNLYNPNCEGKECKENEYFPNHPTQVCRENPFGDPTDTAGLSQETINEININGKNIASINESMITLIQESKNFIDPIWANYEMTGNIWTKNGVLPPLPNYQEGSLSSENMTMETYTQNGAAGINPRYNCFSCHTSDPGKSSAQVAHIFDEGKATGGCEDNKLPPICIQKYTTIKEGK